MNPLDFNWGLPANVSATGDKIDVMMKFLHWFMLVLFVGWGAFMAMCLVKFRARTGHKATYEPIHASWSKWLEIGVAVIEGVLLVVFSMPVWAHFKNDVPADDDPNAIHVHVVAQQFQWNFHYPGKDGKFGRTDPKFVDPQTNPLGIDPDDPNGKDDFVSLKQLHVVAGKPVAARLSTLDVIHSFGVPSLRLKQDAIPGMSIPFWFEVDPKLVEDAKKAAAEHVERTKAALDQITAEAKAAGKDPASDPGVFVRQREYDYAVGETQGVFDIACSQLCGVSHATMRAELHVDTPEQYEKFLADNAPAPAETPAPASPAPTGAHP